MPVLSCGRLTEQKHGYSFSNIISRVPQSDHYHFKYVATLRIVGVFVTIYQGEWTKPLPSSKVKHVHSAGPEPRYLVGKVPSVHVFENINKSHRYELIMKSQAAWVQSGGGGWGLTVRHWPPWLRSEGMTYNFTGKRGDMNPTLTYSLGAMCTHMCIQYDTQCISEYNDPQRWHRSTYLDPGMLKTVDGSFEMPTAEVGCAVYTAVNRQKPSWFHAGTSSNTTSYKPWNTQPLPQPSAHNVLYIAPHSICLLTAPVLPDTVSTHVSTHNSWHSIPF